MLTKPQSLCGHPSTTKPLDTNDMWEDWCCSSALSVYQLPHVHILIGDVGPHSPTRQHSPSIGCGIRVIYLVACSKWPRGYNVANAHPREEWSNIPQEMAGEPDMEKHSRQAMLWCRELRHQRVLVQGSCGPKMTTGAMTKPVALTSPGTLFPEPIVIALLLRSATTFHSVMWNLGACHFKTCPGFPLN